MPAHVQISVLGPVRAWSDGRPLHLGTARQRTVFAVLVAAANRITTAQELIEAIWGASPPAAARSNLYTYISGLRRGLPAGMLESHPTGYLLRLDEGDRDGDRFLRMAAEAVDLQEAGDAAGAAVRLGDALRLWHGEAYAGLEGDCFDVERAHLTRRRLDAIERRARLLVEQDDDGLVAELSGLVLDHPLHEPLYELLMQALHRGGRTAEALEVYTAARGVLVTELGVEPTAGLRDLYRQLLDGSPERRFPAWADLADSTKDLLRVAVLLGRQFRADVLIAANGRAPLQVLAGLEEALDAAVLHDTNEGLAFRDPQLARSVHDSIPAAVRARLHRRVAQALADLGSSVVDVAAQVTAGMPVVDGWVLSWAVEHLAEVTEQAPRLAERLSRLLLRSPLPTDRQREVLLIAYTRSDLRVGGRPDREALQALELSTDPACRAEMRQTLATGEVRDGATARAVAVLDASMADPRTPSVWRTRHRTLLARMCQAGDPYDAIAALQARWLTSSIERDHQTALNLTDRALDLLGEHPAFAELRLDLLDNRIFSLQNLDRLDDAEQTLHDAALVGTRHRIDSPLAVTRAVQQFWTGRWSDAVTGINTLTDDAPGVGMFGRREQRAGALLAHGVAAIIAVHRNDARRAAPHLRAAALTESERENGDFLLIARALLAEQQNRPYDSLDILAPLMDPAYAPMLLRHQWLPDLVRTARQAGRTETAERAADLCAEEAARERTPARAGAALARCQALMSGDPEPALTAAEHYRSVNRVFEHAAALEDAAVLMATRGHAADAARLGREAATAHRRLEAHWDLHRLRRRFAAVDRARPQA